MQSLWRRLSAGRSGGGDADVDRKHAAFQDNFEVSKLRMKEQLAAARSATKTRSSSSSKASRSRSRSRSRSKKRAAGATSRKAAPAPRTEPPPARVRLQKTTRRRAVPVSAAAPKPRHTYYDTEKRYSNSRSSRVLLEPRGPPKASTLAAAATSSSYRSRDYTDSDSDSVDPDMGDLYASVHADVTGVPRMEKKKTTTTTTATKKKKQHSKKKTTDVDALKDSMERRLTSMERESARYQSVNGTTGYGSSSMHKYKNDDDDDNDDVLVDDAPRRFSSSRTSSSTSRRRSRHATSRESRVLEERKKAREVAAREQAELNRRMARKRLENMRILPSNTRATATTEADAAVEHARACRQRERSKQLDDDVRGYERYASRKGADDDSNNDNEDEEEEDEEGDKVDEELRRAARRAERRAKLREERAAKERREEQNQGDGGRERKRESASSAAAAAMLASPSYRTAADEHGRFRGLRGLNNIGNTCFMNSCLQCVCSTPALIHYFTQGLYRRDINPSSRTRGKLAQDLANLILELRTDSSRAFHPSSIKYTVSRLAPRFSGYGQQDVQEFLQFLLDGTHDDLNRVRRKPKYEEIPDVPHETDEETSLRWLQNYRDRNDSMISDLFCGQLQSKVTCLKCGHVSTVYDPFWDISVPIPKRNRSSSSMFSFGSGSSCTLEDCLEEYMREETLRGSNQYYCSRCKKHRDSTKRLRIYRFPHILIITIKRFGDAVSRFSMGRSKLTTKIKFPVDNLDMTPFSPPHRNRRSNYALYGVANHSGGLGGGHYTAYAKISSDEWGYFNDSRASVVSESQIQGREAYVLFYERK